MTGEEGHEGQKDGLSLVDPKDGIKQAKMKNQEDIPLPPSKGVLSDIFACGRNGGRGMFLLIVIGSLRSNPE